MATIKLLLDTRRKADGKKYPLTISVSHKSDVRLIQTGYRLTVDEWEMMQNTIATIPQSKWPMEVGDIFFLKSSYDSALVILSRELDLEELTANDIRDRLQKAVTGKCRAGKVARSKSLFVPRFRQFIESRETDGTKSIYGYTLRRILQYDPDANSRSFEDIGKEWLAGFDAFLQPTVSQNIRNLHFRNIRAVFNDAINDEVTSWYPFRKFKLPKVQETRHRALSLEQLRLLRSCQCEDWMEEYRDMFMLSFYLIGINASDLLTAKKSDVIGGRLEYRRAKTHKPYSVKIEPEAQAVIDKYRGSGELLLSPLERYGDYRDYLHHWNSALKKFGQSFPIGRRPQGEPLFPDLSTYWARHSWATIASSLDIPVEIIARSLGHSWVNKTVTSIYIKFDTKKMDEANRRVIDAVVG